MSDYRAIAGVTASLQNLLQQVAQAAVPGTQVVVGPPRKDPSTSSGVNIFLYRADENPYLRNAELPVRNAEGQYEQLPQLAVNLHYLISFHGDYTKQVPERLLGAIMLTLHAQPILLPRDVRAAEKAEHDEGLELAGSGLEQDAEMVRFVPEPLGHEEMTRLWTLFVQTPYALSLVYRCAVVLIQARVKPVAPLPVRAASRRFITPTVPQISAISPQMLEFGSELPLVIGGHHLAGKGTAIEFGGIRQAPIAGSADELLVALPGGLRAGVQTIQVVRPSAPGSNEALRSNAASFILQPKVEGQPLFAAASGRASNARPPTISIRVEPIVAEGQSVALLLNRVPAPRRAVNAKSSYRIDTMTSETARNELVFDVTNVVPGRYLVRISVGDVSSNLEVDQDSASPSYQQYSAPSVEVR